jgi:molybdenum-dependent DNA-binding transcriptional regulator ModE
MFEDAMGRLINGALWGLGAGLVVTVTRGGGEGLRGAAKNLMKGYLTISERVQEATAEVRENLDDLAAEVRAERAGSSETVASSPR